MRHCQVDADGCIVDSGRPPMSHRRVNADGYIVDSGQRPVRHRRTTILAQLSQALLISQALSGS